MTDLLSPAITAKTPASHQPTRQSSLFQSTVNTKLNGDRTLPPELKLGNLKKLGRWQTTTAQKPDTSRLLALACNTKPNGRTNP
ncbi:MAG: hypothetical protein PHR16_04560 [Methylovulum sp.]|nr:hypothetical protein [Methylovulum sp.]